jgi:hypothetical protein
MKSRVFLSCGQNPSEREIAGKIGELLEGRGFDVYIAVDVQTILEINTGIIRELKDSDCYLFVNFRRERISDRYRGSLFSNQELAIAYALGFERILVVNQDDILREGILKYIGVNTETFATFDDCCATIERALDRSNWTPDYSRRLAAGPLRVSDQTIRYGNLVGRFLYLDVLNQRPDIAALEATGRLAEFGRLGEVMLPSPIRSPLKATGRPGFSHTIFPKSWEAFDLLCVGTYANPVELNVSAPAASGTLVASVAVRTQPDVYMNTAYDVVSAPRLPITPGTWQLRFEFFAIDFPVLSVSIELTFSNWSDPKGRILGQENL